MVGPLIIYSRSCSPTTDVFSSPAAELSPPITAFTPFPSALSPQTTTILAPQSVIGFYVINLINMF